MKSASTLMPLAPNPQKSRQIWGSFRGPSAKQQISGRLSMLVWAFLPVSEDQTRHENAKSMSAMLGIQLLMPLSKYNSNTDIG